MNLRRSHDELDSIFIPIELLEDFEDACGVNWHDNGNCTYTVKIIRDL